MKKILCFLLVLSVLASLCGAACADLTVRRVNPPEEKEEADLSDLKLNREAEIEDFGLLTLTDFQFRDKFYLWEKGMKDTSVNRSGTEADYAVLYADIVNTAPKARTYAAECTVSVMFDGKYHSFVFCQSSEYMADVFDVMKKEYPDFDLYIIDSGRSISFRSVKKEVNVGAIAKPLGGGGHPGAAGVSIPFETRRSMLEEVLGTTMYFD